MERAAVQGAVQLEEYGSAEGAKRAAKVLLCAMRDVCIADLAASISTELVLRLEALLSSSQTDGCETEARDVSDLEREIKRRFLVASRQLVTEFVKQKYLVLRTIGPSLETLAS